MANNQNLKPIRDSQRARELQEKSVKKYYENKAARASLKDEAEKVLNDKYKDKNGEYVTGARAVMLRAFEKALKGDIKSLEFIRDTAGQKPVDKIMVAEVEQETIDEIEALVASYDERHGG